MRSTTIGCSLMIVGNMYFIHEGLGIYVGLCLLFGAIYVLIGHKASQSE